jgi:hypothetical protein
VEINSWPGAIAVVLAIISFYGTTYAVISLNVGWRFGYWLASACFGALMVLLSLFWVLNVRPDQAVGPQGALPRWIPAAAAAEEIAQIEYKGVTITAPSSYPAAPWEPASEGDPRVDQFGSAISNCLSLNEKALAEEPEPEKSTCEQAQKLMPGAKEVPVIDGTKVVVVPKVEEVRFAEDNGVIAEAEVHPLTTDPRVTKDPDGKVMAPPFKIVAILDKGSVGLPSYMALVVFSVYAAFHLWGLHRAERRKLSPAVL